MFKLVMSILVLIIVVLGAVLLNAWRLTDDRHRLRLDRLKRVADSR